MRWEVVGPILGVILILGILVPRWWYNGHSNPGKSDIAGLRVTMWQTAVTQIVATVTLISVLFG